MSVRLAEILTCQPRVYVHIHAYTFVRETPLPLADILTSQPAAHTTMQNNHAADILRKSTLLIGKAQLLAHCDLQFLNSQSAARFTVQNSHGADFREILPAFRAYPRGVYAILRYCVYSRAPLL